MSRWLLVLILLNSSTGFAQYYDDDYEDDYYGSPFSPPPSNSQNPQPRPNLPGASNMASQELQQEAQSDNGRLIPSESGTVKFKIVEGQFWEPKKKRQTSNSNKLRGE